MNRGAAIKAVTWIVFRLLGNNRQSFMVQLNHKTNYIRGNQDRDGIQK